MAAQRIAPPQFSESRVSRLQELRAAKRRAEGRQAASGSRDDQSRADSVSSSSSTATLMLEEEVDGEVQKWVWALGSILVVLTMLLFLRRHRMVVDLHLVARNALDVLLVALQAIALQALLNAVLLYSFDGFDFGQRKLVTHMNYGRRLFAREVKKISRLTAIVAAATSCGCAVMGESVQKLRCLLANVDAFTDVGEFSVVSWVEGMSLPRFDLRQLSFGTAETQNDTGWIFAPSVDIGKAIFRHAGSATTWVAAKLLPVAHDGLKSVATSSSVMLKHALLHLSSACQRACDAGARPRQRWGARALDISSFFTLRLGVFVVALLLMGWVLLPKPDKKGRGQGHGKQKRVSDVAEDGSVADVLDGSRHASSVSGNISVLEVITEEEI